MNYSSSCGKIIVAEDQLHNMMVIKELMNKVGRAQDCEFVYNGDEAVIKFSELVSQGHHVSHVLTDFMMPRTTGIDAVKAIQGFVEQKNKTGEVQLRQPKVVFLTAYKNSIFDKHL